jgi:hypothetical protein
MRCDHMQRPPEKVKHASLLSQLEFSTVTILMAKEIFGGMSGFVRNPDFGCGLIASWVMSSWRPTMTTVQEYRKFAEECLRWATEAETEEFKNAFIEMARDWTLAAMRLDGVVSAPLQVGRSGAQTPEP